MPTVARAFCASQALTKLGQEILRATIVRRANMPLLLVPYRMYARRARPIPTRQWGAQPARATSDSRMPTEELAKAVMLANTKLCREATPVAIVQQAPTRRAITLNVWPAWQIPTRRRGAQRRPIADVTPVLPGLTSRARNATLGSTRVL